MKKILVDTDILINFLRGKEKARDFLLSLLEDSTCYISVISIAEIFAGMKEHEREKTIALIESLNIADVTYSIAQKAGSYKNQVKTHSLELDDCLIAASAFELNAVLATGNGRHYPMADIRKTIISPD
ncbi:MAG: type II toxin-antitoxin system VapC family toxin [Nitrospirae bacterium]|nr:type II toxin-antitoxin system VapC family toxin [Nitrospirota bacterium]